MIRGLSIGVLLLAGAAAFVVYRAYQWRTYAQPALPWSDAFTRAFKNFPNTPQDVASAVAVTQGQIVVTKVA